MGWRARFRTHATRREPGQLPEPLRWRPRVRIFGLVSGAIGGAGTVVLVQQYGIEPLSRRLGLQGVLGGLASGIVVPSAIWAIVVAVHNRRLRAAASRLGRRIGGPSPAGPGVAAVVLLPLAIGAAVFLLSTPRAGAEVDGPCLLGANGIDARALPLDPSAAVRLDEGDTLEVTLGAPQTVVAAEIGVKYAGQVFVIASGTDDDRDADDGTGDGGQITLAFAVDDVAWMGGGLYEFYGFGELADGTDCTGAFLFDVDVDPLETLMGLAAAGSTAIGVAGLLGMSTSGILEGSRYLRDLQSVVVDLDGDGVADATAFDHDQDGTLDTFGLDTDGDGRIDQVAWDSDGDGVIDRTSTAWDADADLVPDDSFDDALPEAGPDAGSGDGPDAGPIEDLEGEPPEPFEDLEGELPEPETLTPDPDAPAPDGPPTIAPPVAPPTPPEMDLGPIGEPGEAPGTALPPDPGGAPTPGPGGPGFGDEFWPVETRTPDEVWDAAQDKIDAENFERDVVLDPSEYLEWLTRFEQANPGATPQQILTALHAQKYPHDIHANFPEPLEDLPLFRWGPETAGWEPVAESLRTFSRHSPQFIEAADGTRVDIAHIYAGPRAGFDREGLDDVVATIANTHAGDVYQVVFQGPNLFPNDQMHGNNLGIGLSLFYADPANADVPVSDALRGMLRPGTFTDAADLPGLPDVESLDP